MFAVTFLGHQGWLVATARTRLLVDPLLVEAFGHGGEVGAVYPPRALDVARVPPVHGVLLTHEHEDHFNLPSLHRLDRAIPVYLSARASDAARAVLGEMGFRVHAAVGGAPFAVGDLEVHAFNPDQSDEGQVGDEWDLLQFLVRDRAGDGSFFAGVDMAVSDAVLGELRAVAAAPGLWCHTNNAANWSMAVAGYVNPHDPRNSTARTALQTIDAHAALCERWQPPVASLLCGGGFAFGPDRAALNRNVFEADSAQIAAALAAVFPGQAFAAVTPGQTVAMAGGRLAGGAATAPFLAPRPRAAWPARAFVGDLALLEDYAPFAPRRALAPGDLDELARHLEDLARFLYGGALFRAAYAAPGAVAAGRRARLALALRDGDEGDFHVFEYAPEGCAFVRVASADPAADYVCGLECWATDLLALFRGEAGPTSVVFGRGRAWSYAPEFAVSIAFFFHYFSPLCRPAAFLRLYRRLAAQEPPDAPCVPAGGPAE